MSSPILEKMGSQYPEGRKCDINSNLFLKKGLMKSVPL
jgi:hypothetical protein